MKKIVSLLIVMAMLMAFAPTVFAASESGNLMIGPGATADWQAPATGTVTISTETGSSIAVDGGNTFMGVSGTFSAVEGQTYTFQNFGSGFEIVYWSVEVNGGVDSDATSGTVVIESYSSGDFTAPKDGTIKLTMDYADAEMDIVIGNSYIGTIANGETINVTAGTTYSVYPLGVPVDATLTWEYVEGGAGDSGDEGDEPQQSNTIAPGEGVNIPAVQGDELVISVSHGDCYLLDSPYRTSPVDGIITHTVSDFMGSGYVSLVNYSQTETLTWDYAEAPEQGGDEGENLNAQYQGDGSYYNPFVITELPANLGITMTMIANDYYFVYEVTEAGVISFGETDLTIWPEIMGVGVNYNSNPIQVAAGDVVFFNVFGGNGNYYFDINFEAGATLPEGGDDEEPTEPSEPDGTMGNPFIVEELPFTVNFYGGMDEYYLWTATANGIIKANKIDGALLSTSANYDMDDNYYYITVAAGDEVTLNPWTMRADISGAMTFEFVPEGSTGDDETEIKMEATDAAISKDGIKIPFTPDADGVLTVVISGKPGYDLKVENAADDSTVGLPTKSGLDKTVTFDLLGGVTYNICIAGFSTAEWDYVDATISYSCTFEASELEVEKEDLLETSVELVVGEQNVELLPNAVTTLFNFYAPEAGVYTITLPEGATAALYSVAWTAYQTSEGNTLVFTATAEGQGFLVGLTSEEASFNVKVEKTGTYTPPAATTYLPYEPTTPVDADFQMPEGEVTNVDITEAHSAVLGNDGFYHLDTVDGPILYVNLNSDGFTLATLLDAGAPITMRGEKFQDENGDLFCYDYMNMIAFGDYYSYSQECDYYPLNADLMAFFQDYGAAQGWYNANFSNFDAIKSGEFNEESAWMIALVYIADDAGDQGGEGGDNAQTGDFGIVAASLALSLSAICGTALIVKKKEI